MAKLSCAVTGGSGFLGQNLLEALIGNEEFDKVFSVDRRLLPWSHPKVESVVVDTGDTAAMTQLLRGVDRVFHLAADADVDVINKNPTSAVSNNVGATCSLLEASRKAGVSRFLFASTAWVYMNAEGHEMTESTSVFPATPSNLYAATKLAGELLCHSYTRQFGLPCTILRFSTPYGRYMRPELVVQRFLDQAAGGQVITINGGGYQSRDFIYADDLARGVVLAALAPSAEGKTYNLPGPRPVTIRELVEVIQRVVPGAAGVVYTDSRPADFAGHLISGDRALGDLGWQPRVDVEQGIQLVYDWLTGSAEQRCIA